MEPKFREIVRRDPNVDLKNTPISEGPASDKVQAVAGGPLYILGKTTDGNKLVGDLRQGLQFFTQRGNELKQYNQSTRDMRRTPAGGYKLTDDPAYKLHENGGKI